MLNIKPEEGFSFFDMTGDPMRFSFQVEKMKNRMEQVGLDPKEILFITATAECRTDSDDTVWVSPITYKEKRKVYEGMDWIRYGGKKL